MVTSGPKFCKGHALFLLSLLLQRTLPREDKHFREGISPTLHTYGAMQRGFLADVVFYLSPRLSVEEGEQIREAITTAGGEMLHTFISCHSSTISSQEQFLPMPVRMLTSSFRLLVLW